MSSQRLRPRLKPHRAAQVARVLAFAAAATGMGATPAAPLAASPAAPAAEARPLRLASDDWCPFVCAAGDHLTGGYLVDAVRLALASQGLEVEPVLMPLNRAVAATVGGQVDGIYAPALDKRLRLSPALAWSRACFYTLADQRWSYSGMAALPARPLGIIDNYGYDGGAMDAYVAAHQHDPLRLVLAFGQSAGVTNLNKLLAGRLGVLLEHEAVMAQLAQRQQATQRIRQAGCLEQPLPLTVGFAAGDSRAAAWISALNAGMAQLEANGQLAALRQRHHLPPH